MKLHLVVDKVEFDKLSLEIFYSKELVLTASLVKAFEMFEDELFKVIEWDFKCDRENFCYVMVDVPPETIHLSLSHSIFNNQIGSLIGCKIESHCSLPCFTEMLNAEGKFSIGDDVICSFGKDRAIENILEVKECRKMGGSRYARGTSRPGKIQFINQKAAVVRHTDNLFPNEDYEDAYYLINEIKPA